MRTLSKIYFKECLHFFLFFFTNRDNSWKSGHAKLKISASISPGRKTNRPSIKMNVMISIMTTRWQQKIIYCLLYHFHFVIWFFSHVLLMDLYLDIKITIIAFKNLLFVKIQHCFVLKYEVARVFNSSDLLESQMAYFEFKTAIFSERWLVCIVYNLLSFSQM